MEDLGSRALDVGYRFYQGSEFRIKGLRVSFGAQGLGSRVWFFIGTGTKIYRSRCRRLLTGLQRVYVYGTVYYFEKDKGGLRSSSLCLRL